jgi:hypothetical protein
MTDEFTIPRKEKFYGEYIGQFVMIYPISRNEIFNGRLIDVKDGLAILNPFQGSEVTGEGKLIRKLIPKNSKVNIIGVVAIEPTTEENLVNYCNARNKEAEKIKAKDKTE